MVGDFNGDVHLDLATVDTAAISILLGNGDGSFKPPKDLPAHQFANGIATADWKGDGNSTRLSVRKRRGGLSWQRRRDL